MSARYFGPRHRRRPVGHLLIPTQITRLVLPAHMAVANLPDGHFSIEAWHDIAGLCDVCQLLAHDAGLHEVVRIGEQANAALLSIRERHGRVGRWGASGPELLLLQQSVNALDTFLRRQTSDKVRDVLLRLDAALAKCPAGATVIDPASVPGRAAP